MMSIASSSTFGLARKFLHQSTTSSNKFKIRWFSATAKTLSTSKQNEAEKVENDDDERVIVRIDDKTKVATVTLNRPKKLNALDMKMFEAIADTASSLKKNKSLRAVILNGSGRAFCSGLDVTSMMTKTNPLKATNRLLQRPSGYGDEQSEEDQYSNLAQDVGYLWRQIPAPVICVIHGICYGGAMQIALGADFRFSTKDCKFSIMEAKWGIIPDMSASVTLRELVRIDVAKELTMTGRIFDGKEAANLGLVTRCVEHPMDEAEKFVTSLIDRSPDSISASKRLYQSTWVAPEEYCLKVETDLQRTLLASWNQIAASGRNFGFRLPYFRRKEPPV